MKIELISGTYRIKSVKKKTGAKVFCGFQAGDIIIFTTDLSAPGSNRTWSKTKQVLTFNFTKDIGRTLTFNQLEPILECFELEKE